MSSATAASLLKPLSFSDMFLTSPAPMFPKPSLSFLPSKPFNFPLLAKSATSRFRLAPFVARTSDWVQPEEEEGGGWAGEAREAEEEGSGGGFAEPSEDVKLFIGNSPYDIDSDAVAIQPGWSCGDCRD